MAERLFEARGVREGLVGALIKGVVFDVKRYAIHDGPGIRTTVFLKGCPLACRWCHNPEGQASEGEMLFRSQRCIGCRACLEACPSGALFWNENGPAFDRRKCTRCGACAAVCYAEARERVGREVAVEEVMAEVERDTAFYEESGGGVTFSGGEPLAQPDFLHALLRASKEKGIRTALDTCGHAPWEAIERVRGLVDLFLYDLKIVDGERHREFTGVSNEMILKNLQELSRHGHDIFLRVAIIPGINDDERSVREIGAFACGLPRLNEINILSYNRLGIEKYARLNRTCPLTDVRGISDDRMAGIVQCLSAFGLRVKRGG